MKKKVIKVYDPQLIQVQVRQRQKDIFNNL